MSVVLKLRKNIFGIILWIFHQSCIISHSLSQWKLHFKSFILYNNAIDWNRTLRENVLVFLISYLMHDSMTLNLIKEPEISLVKVYFWFIFFFWSTYLFLFSHIEELDNGAWFSGREHMNEYIYFWSTTEKYYIICCVF